MNEKYEVAKADVPYFELGKILLDCIFKALEVCIENDNLQPSDPALRKCFKPFFLHELNQRGINPHFLLGNTKKENFEPRICKIVIQSYREIEEDSKSGQGFSLPSPLFILQQILTVPSELQSSAFTQLFCRSLLFETFKVFPEHPLIPRGYQSVNIINIKSYIDTFSTYTIQHNNIPIVESIPQQLMLAHYLGLKGIFYFRFGESKAQIKGRKNIKSSKTKLATIKNNCRKNAKKYLGERKLFVPAMQRGILTFHKVSLYEELPEADSLMNELAGIPVPIRGAETIFQGGIKTDSNSNLVIRISGEPGTGKTSFALALSASMSPFSTFTYYMSLEENPKDLKNRLYSLIPGYLKKLSIYNPDIDSWFWADKIPLSNKNRLDYFETEYIDKIAEKLNTKKHQTLNNSLPAVCPLIIVIDSIRILLNEQNSDLEKFIEKCKGLNAIIILISANDEKFHHEIDYMVDLVVNLKYFGATTQNEKPISTKRLIL